MNHHQRRLAGMAGRLSDNERSEKEFRSKKIGMTVWPILVNSFFPRRQLQFNGIFSSHKRQQNLISGLGLFQYNFCEVLFVNC